MRRGWGVDCLHEVGWWWCWILGLGDGEGMPTLVRSFSLGVVEIGDFFVL